MYVPGSEQFSSFSEMTSEAGSMQSAVPRGRHGPMYNRERSNQSHGRESVFSETSTELSMSSNSDKEFSPSKCMYVYNVMYVLSYHDMGRLIIVEYLV